MSELRNPHDRFFKESFSRQEVARDFLQNYLPDSVLIELDLDSLELQKDSYIDPELQEHFSDLLYQIKFKNESTAFVYLLFEHKSRPENLVAFQLLRYMVRIWEQGLKSNHKQLVPILPLVIYHGLEQWAVALRFEDLFVGPESLRGYWPSFHYELFDLSDYPDEEIKGIVLLRVCLLLLKHIFDDDLVESLPRFLRLLKDLKARQTGLQYLETILRYVSGASSKLSEEGMVQALNLAFPKLEGELMTTLAEKWIEQGIERGIEQGIEQGVLQANRENVLDVLITRFGHVSTEIRRAIETNNSLATLKALLHKAILAQSLEDFAQELP